MTNPAVTAEVHQALDIHRDIATQIALNLKIRNRRSQLRNFWLGEIFDFRRRIDASRFATLFCTRVADTVDRRQCDHDVLIQRYVYS
jgi:hypothetical protein